MLMSLINQIRTTHQLEFHIHKRQMALNRVEWNGTDATVRDDDGAVEKKGKSYFPRKSVQQVEKC